MNAKGRIRVWRRQSPFTCMFLEGNMHCLNQYSIYMPKSHIYNWIQSFSAVTMQTKQHVTKPLIWLWLVWWNRYIKWWKKKVAPVGVKPKIFVFHCSANTPSVYNDWKALYNYLGQCLMMTLQTIIRMFHAPDGLLTKCNRACEVMSDFTLYLSWIWQLPLYCHWQVVPVIWAECCSNVLE